MDLPDILAPLPPPPVPLPPSPRCQLASCTALRCLIDDVQFYDDQFLPFLEPSLRLLFGLAQRVAEFDSQVGRPEGGTSESIMLSMYGLANGLFVGGEAWVRRGGGLCMQ